MNEHCSGLDREDGERIILESQKRLDAEGVKLKSREQRGGHNARRRAQRFWKEEDHLQELAIATLVHEPARVFGSAAALQAIFDLSTYPRFPV